MKKRSLSVLMVLCIILTLVTPVAAAPIPAPPPENCTVKYKEQTEGVTYEGYEKKDDVYVVTYTIEQDAPSDLVIDLGKCAGDLWENEQQMPGNHYIFQIQITNQSGKTYAYKDKSFVVAPGDASKYGTIDDGSALPVLTYDGQYVPVRFSGAMIPYYFYKNIFKVEKDVDVTFEMMCNIYNYLEKMGYTGENAITQYLLGYFNEQRSTNYVSLTELFSEHPDWMDGSLLTNNGIYTVSKEVLDSQIQKTSWIEPFLSIEQCGEDEYNVQIKWPEPEIAAVSYNSFYQGLFSVVFGKENAEKLNPNGDGVEFSRAHAVGDYMYESKLYEETNSYFTELTKDGFQTGETMEIWSGYGIDGPGMGNSYQNYEFTYYNVIELEEVSEPAPPIESGEWDVSKSKTAENLVKRNDGTYTSEVTLSLPAAEEELVSDVVFVLDKSTSAELEEQALQMLQDLKNQIAAIGAKVKVGVVIFNKEAHATELLDLTTEYDAIEAAIKQEIQSGTNTHAGLLAGKALLDSDTSVDDSRKYLVFVSDGITYMYNAVPTVTAWTFQADSVLNWAGPDNWKSKYGNGEAPADWEEWMDTIGTQVTAQGTTYEYPYGGTIVQATPLEGWQTAYANSVDKALYETCTTYQDLASSYHCYAMAATSNADYPWALSFMNYLANGRSVSFSDIKNDIYYLLDAGSKVVDVIGSGKDNHSNDYNFDFVSNIDNLTLTVGGTELDVTELTDLSENETARYGFGPDESAEGGYKFILKYYANGQDGKSDECFVWDINVPVSKFEPVQLTYTVKLTDPQTAKGTYGKYDADGSEKYEGLYTNNEAILYPVDSNENEGKPENFAKPTVSYTVSGSSSGGGGGNKPSLNTEDHYGYIVGYPVDYETGEPTDDQARKPVKPQGKITRAEVATIFFRMLTDESRNEYWSQSNDFTDVAADAWYNNAISTMANAGILDGYEDGSFHPNGYITRAEFATSAVRFFDLSYQGEDLFPDIDGHWAQDYINQAADAGIIEGYPDGTFGPQKQITRAEAVTMVNRTLDRHPDPDHFLEDMLVWPDNLDTEAWYYADIQEATNSHEYQMKKDAQGNEYEVWTKILPIRDWEALEKAWSDANSSENPGDVV